MSHVPTVSVYLPTCNRVALLREAIDSVLGQTFQDFELIVSDNASTDGTADLVRGYADRRLRYRRNPRNLGVYGNYEPCFALARGRYIGFLPDDDVMLPENLARKVAVLERHPSVGLVHSRYHLMDKSGAILLPSTNWGHGPTRDADAIDRGIDLLQRMLLSYNRINEPTAVFRRECHERLGGFKPSLPYTFDWEYWMRIAGHYDIAYLAEPLIKWRLHADALTACFVVSDRGLTPLGLREQMLAKHLALQACRARIPQYPAFAARVYAGMAAQLYDYTAHGLRAAGPTPWAVQLVLGVVARIPPLARDGMVAKILLRTLLGARPTRVVRKLLGTLPAEPRPQATAAAVRPGAEPLAALQRHLASEPHDAECRTDAVR
jgi:hypothetical protein